MYELEGEVALHGTLVNYGRESLIMVYILDDERRRGLLRRLIIP